MERRPIPAVFAGVVVTGLVLERTFATFGNVVTGIAFVVAFEVWRTRPPKVALKTAPADA